MIPMPHTFNRLAQAAIISGNSDFAAGLPVLLGEKADLTASGWDTLTQTWAIRTPALTAEMLAASYPVGSRLDGRYWWLQTAKPAIKTDGVWTFELGYAGWAAEKPAKFTWGSDKQETNIVAPADPFLVTGVGTAERVVKVSSYYPTLSVTYLIEDFPTGEEPTLDLGLARAQWEAYLPPFPATSQVDLGGTIPFWPRGWHLGGLVVDRLAGCTAALVTENLKGNPASIPE